MIRIKQIPIGPMENFCYLLSGASSNTGTVIDPGWAGVDVDKIISTAQKENIFIKYIIATHSHYDHIGGVNDLIQKTEAEFFIHENESSWLSNLKSEKSYLLKDGDEVDLDGFSAKIIHTPGHTSGGICIYTDNKLFTGDTLFVGGCGRANFPDSDPKAYYYSLYETLLSLPDDTEIFTGHDYGARQVSTIGYERNYNPYLNCNSISEFIKLRMG